MYLKDASNSEIPGQIGILLVFGATGTIGHNKITENLFSLEYGSNYLSQTQAFNSFLFCWFKFTITNNIISNNDAGIDVIGSNGCCIVDRNTP